MVCHFGPGLRQRWRCWRPSSGPLGVGQQGEQHRCRLGGKGRPERRPPGAGTWSIDVVGTGEAWSRILWLEGVSDANSRGFVPSLNASSCTGGGRRGLLPPDSGPERAAAPEVDARAGRSGHLAPAVRPLRARRTAVPEPHRRIEWGDRRFRISSRHTEGRLSAGNSRPARRARR